MIAFGKKLLKKSLNRWLFYLKKIMKKYKCIKSFVAKGYIVEKGTVWVFDLLESFINVRLDSVDDDVYVEISYEAFSNKFEEVA